MQSDERVDAALSALRPRIAAFRLAVSGALERAKNTLASESGPDQARVALGDFAAGLINPDRFAMISSGFAPLDSVGLAIVERAVKALEALLRAGDEDFIVDVRAGTSAAVAIRARMLSGTHSVACTGQRLQHGGARRRRPGCGSAPERTGLHADYR